MELEAATMAYGLLVLGGAVVAASALAWWVHRFQRDIDAYQEREYREPLIFQLPRGPIG